MCGRSRSGARDDPRHSSVRPFFLHLPFPVPVSDVCAHPLPVNSFLMALLSCLVSTGSEAWVPGQRILSVRVSWGWLSSRDNSLPRQDACGVTHLGHIVRFCLEYLFPECGEMWEGPGKSQGAGRTPTRLTCPLPGIPQSQVSYYWSFSSSYLCFPLSHLL